MIRFGVPVAAWFSGRLHDYVRDVLLESTLVDDGLFTRQAMEAILVAHSELDVDMFDAYCDHLIVLHGGRVVTEGPTESVLTEDLLADVYGLDAIVTPHPRTGRPHVLLCGTVTERAST